MPLCFNCEFKNIKERERETFLLYAYVRSYANSHIFDYRDRTTLILDW